MADGVILLSAAQAIKVASKKVKLTPELEKSIEQLDSIAKLLELNAPSPAITQRLSLLLRQTLLPLYNTFLVLGIRYAVAVLGTIFDAKMLPLLEDLATNSVANWEAVQASLLSGILDFLESNPSYETRDIVANSFYPTLRDVFFPRMNLTFRPGPDLMYILCQLLSETVTLHPDNQAQLRNKDVLGGTKLGLVLSQSKNILVIEALLELIVKLLPSKRTNGTTRNEFVQEVFNVANFACGDAILRIIETTPPNANWDVVFIKIIDLLGNTKPSFPQPFKTSNFHIQDFHKAYNVERLYVDHFGFVANIDEGDQIETLHALYASIESLKVTTPRDGKITVTILFSPPPSVGQVAIVTPSGKRATVAFDIAAGDAARFLSSLELRNVDRGRDLARLWDLSNSQSHTGQALPTSPLMPCAVSEVQDGSTLVNPSDFPIRRTPVKTSSPYYDSIFGTTDEELTDFSDKELNPPPRQSTTLPRGKQLPPVGNLQLEVVESDKESQIVRKVKSRRKTIVLSDVETDQVKSLQNVHATVKSASTESDARYSSKVKGRSLVKGTLPDDKAADRVGGKVDQPVLNPNSMADSPHKPDSLPSCANERIKPKRKRKLGGDNAPGPDSECRYSKRLRIRSGAAKTPIEYKSPPKPDPARRRVRKRRTSLCNLPFGTDPAFGEGSVPSSDFLPKPKEKQSKVFTMKVKGGKKSAGRAIPDKKKLQSRVETSKYIPTFAPPERAQSEVRMPSDNTEGLLHDNIVIQDKDKHYGKSTQRRSARVAKVSNAIDEGIKMEKDDPATSKVEPFQDEDASKQQVHLQKKLVRAPSNDNSIKQPFTADTSRNVTCAIEPSTVPTIVSHEAITQEEILGKQISPALPQVAGIHEGSLHAEFAKSTSFQKVKDESKQSKLETPRILIDLTEDSPPITATRIVERHSKLRIEAPAAPSPFQNVSNHEPLASALTFISSPEPRHLPKADRPRVSFSPSASFDIHSVCDTTELELETPDYSKAKENSFASNKYRHSQSHAQKPFDTEYVQQTANKCEADSMPKILGILDEINKVMKHKSSYRFNKVSKDLRAGEGAILRETAQHLEEIHVESAEHHNNFVNLEAQYASYHRKIIQGLKDERENKQKTATFLAATIQEHNRNSLSRRFPNNFFNTPLPSVLLNPQLKL